jgi:hypothetical protein
MEEPINLLLYVLREIYISSIIQDIINANSPNISIKREKRIISIYLAISLLSKSCLYSSIAILYCLLSLKKSFISGFIISSFRTILNKSIAFSLTSLLLLYNITKVGTIKALASKAIFVIARVRAKAIEGVALGVVSIRLFSPKTY